MRIRLAIAALLLPLAAQAETLPDRLYQAQAYVTGTRAETRQDGIITSFRRVLVEVSGNPALLSDSRVDALESRAAGLVEDLAYIDRMSDDPHHDEQGTRDRPFDLMVHFNPGGIATVLTELGENPWAAPRPRVLVRVNITDHDARFALAADTESDERHRESLLAAADRYGLRVVLAPAEGAAPRLDDAVVTLDGTLIWSEADFGWVGRWELSRPNRRWSIAGVSFDDAFRDAMAGTLAELSGHTTPQAK